METIKTFISALIIALCIFAFSIANAQNRNIISAETNLAFLAMKGYSINLFLKPSFTKKIKLGIGIYSLTNNSISMQVSSSNNNCQQISLHKENIRIINSPTFHFEYYPNSVNKKWFIGEQFSFLYYQMFLSDGAKWSGKLRKNSWMTYGGYVYQFPNLPIYIKIWTGVGFFRLAGKSSFYLEKFEYKTMITYMTGFNTSFIF